MNGDIMFKTIKSISMQRLSWLLLTLSAVLMESFALYMQHAQGLEPCNECIYIRVGVLAIAAAGMIGAAAPRVLVVRWSALAVWLSGLGWSLYRADLLLNLEQKVREGAEASCARFKGFPEWMPLERWLPNIFEPRAMCGSVSWTFLSQSITFWIWIALLIMALMAILVSAAQLRQDG
jgi:disulfide bond formation protein DsbB